MNFLQFDSPVMKALTKVADLMIINLLAIFCSLPIITAGAAFTALHYCALKIARDEEVYITKHFFHSFKENFKQSTVLWLIMLVFLCVVGLDIYFVTSGAAQLNTTWFLITTVMTFLIGFVLIMVFPVQAKFTNTIPGTIRTALVVAVLQFPKTFLMMVVTIAPFFLAIYYFKLFPLFICFGFSGPAFLSALMYNKTFKKMEDRYYEEHAPEVLPDEDEHIFSDAPLLPETDAAEEKKNADLFDTRAWEETK